MKGPPLSLVCDGQAAISRVLFYKNGLEKQNSAWPARPHRRVLGIDYTSINNPNTRLFNVAPFMLRCYFFLSIHT